MQNLIIPKNIKERANFFGDLLKSDYPTVDTPLYHRNAFELLAATMLSAQTLDETTNKVTPFLFEKYPNPEKLSEADPVEIKNIIRVVNYNKTKSENLVKMAQKLINDFEGIVPQTIDELTTLPGIGRKTANVVISEWFGKPAPTEAQVLERRKKGFPDLQKDKNFKPILPEGFVVDTHVARVSYNFGLTTFKDPVKIEQDLMKLFPRNEWNDMSLRFIFHGRYVAPARGKGKWEDHVVWKEVYGQIQKKGHL